MKKKYLTLVLILFSLFSSININKATAQISKDFWYFSPFIDQFKLPNYIIVSTFKKNATITISQPEKQAFAPIIQKVNANSSFTFDVTAFASGYVITASGSDTHTIFINEDGNTVKAGVGYSTASNLDANFWRFNNRNLEK